jgi:Phage terminase large subunit
MTMKKKTMKTKTGPRLKVGKPEHYQDGLAAGCPPDQIANFLTAGYVAQPKQWLFHAACRACDAPDGPTQVGFGGARGGAKSHAMLCQIALDDCRRQPGLKALLLRKVGKAAKEGFEDLRAKILRTTTHEWRRGEGILTFPNGSRIILGHFKDESDIDAYLGLEYDVIGVEEATTLTHSKYRAIRTCNRTSKAGWRPRIYTTTNPGGVGHTWYKATFIRPWQAARESDTRFVPSTVDDNRFVNAGYTSTLDALTGWQKRAWRYGEWDISAGQFFTTFRPDVHAVDPFPIPPHWPVWLAMDYGFTHYNVILLFARDGEGPGPAGREGCVYVVDELAAQRWLVPRHALALDSMLARHGIAPARLAGFVAGRDVFAARPTDQGSVADQWAAAGWFLDPAVDDRINGAAEILRRLGDPDATGGSPERSESRSASGVERHPAHPLHLPHLRPPARMPARPRARPPPSRRRIKVRHRRRRQRRRRPLRRPPLRPHGHPRSAQARPRRRGIRLMARLAQPPTFNIQRSTYWAQPVSRLSRPFAPFVVQGTP